MRITYNTRIIFDCQEDYWKVFQTLEASRTAFNEASKLHFGADKNSIVDIHRKFYRNFRAANPTIPSQVVIVAENEVLATYRSIKSNKQKIENPPEKKNLSMRLDKHLYTWKKNKIRLTTIQKSVIVDYQKYAKLNELFLNYKCLSPLLFVRNSEIWLGFTFEIPDLLPQTKELAVGVDLGIKRVATTSEGVAFVDKKFNRDKRKLRHLKKQLRAAKDSGSKSAKRHLKKLKRKERNKNRYQTHLVCNAILDSTKANVIVLEDLTKIKQNPKNKHRKKFNNKMGQVPFFMLRQFLTYKAQLRGRRVIVIDPKFTSQIDHVTGKREGERIGCRFYSKSGAVFDADHNAAINIAIRSKLPVSYKHLLDGQVVVTRPNVPASCGANPRLYSRG